MSVGFVGNYYVPRSYKHSLGYLASSLRASGGLSGFGALPVPGNPVPKITRAVEDRAKQRASEAGQYLIGQAEQMTGIDPTSIPTSGKGAVSRLGKEFQRQTGIPTTQKGVESKIKKEAAAQFEKQTGVPISRLPSSPKDAARLAVQSGKKLVQKEADKVYSDALKDMGLPYIPLEIPDNLLSAEGVKNVAYGVAKPYIEDVASDAIGYPIVLPDELTLEAFGDAAMEIIPDSIEDVVDIGLTIASEAAASAITSALVAAGIGSVIPGLGTVVGLAVALAVSALKDAADTGRINKSLDYCETRWKCNPIPANTAPVDLLPWIVPEQINVERAILLERERRGFCGRGPTIDCANFLSTLTQDVARFAKTSVPVLNIPQLDALIPKYQTAFEHAQKSRASSTAANDIYHMLPGMHARRKKLQALVDKANRVEQLPPRELSSLRWDLVTEMREGAKQYQFQRTEVNKQWFISLAQFFGRYENDRIARLKRRAQERVAGRKRAAVAIVDPAKRAAHERQLLQLRCGDAVDWNQCIARERPKVRAIVDREAAALTKSAPAPGGTMPHRTAVLPRPATAPRVRSQFEIDRALIGRCKKLVQQVKQQYPKAAKCLNRFDEDKIHALCMQAYGPARSITPAQALQATFRIGAEACAREASKRAQPKPAISAAQQRLITNCHTLVTQLKQRNPQAAQCLLPADTQQIHALCMQAYSAKTITPQQALQQANQIVVAACARRG